MSRLSPLVELLEKHGRDLADVRSVLSEEQRATIKGYKAKRKERADIEQREYDTKCAARNVDLRRVWIVFIKMLAVYLPIAIVLATGYAMIYDTWNIETHPLSFIVAMTLLTVLGVTTFEYAEYRAWSHVSRSEEFNE